MQTYLAYYIQYDIYQPFYLYAAAEMNPTNNHPTSRPCLIAERWGRVVMKTATAEGMQSWTLHKARLEAIAEDYFIAEKINEDGVIAVHHATTTATVQDASPSFSHSQQRMTIHDDSALTARRAVAIILDCQQDTVLYCRPLGGADP